MPIFPFLLVGMRPRPFGRGYHQTRDVNHRDHGPSMRPRPFGRGYAHPCRDSRCRRASFNEATTFRPWITPGAGTDGHSRRTRWPFNEATTFRPWIRGPAGSGYSMRSSGAFNEATTFRPWILPAEDGPTYSRGTQCPSMRPRPFGRGYRHHADRLDVVGAPSMRPRPFGRGYLQLPAGLDLTGQPSMRPRPFGRGYP